MSIILNGKIATGVPTPNPDGRTLFANASDNGRLYVKLPSGSTVALESSSGCGPCGSSGFTCGTGAPVTPGTNSCDMYVDSSTGNIYLWDGTALVRRLNNASGGGGGANVGTGAPVGAGTIVGEIYVDDDTGDIYVWDGSTWLQNAAAGGGSFTCADVANCINTDSNTQTALQNFVESTTFNTITTNDLTVNNNANFNGTNNYNNVTENYTGGVTNYDSSHITNDNGTTNYSSTAVENHNGDTINYVAVTENYNDTPNQISCEAGAAFGTGYAAPATTQYVEVVISGDTYKILVDSDQNILTSTYEVSATWAPAGTVTFAIVSGTPTLDSLCRYNGVSVTNNTNNITNNNGTITNNNNVNDSYSNSNVVYDSTTNVTMDNLEVTNLTITNMNASSLARNIITNIAASLAVIAGDFVIDNHSAADTIVSLPTAVGIAGKVIMVKKNNSSTFKTVVRANGAELINGFTDANITVDQSLFSFISDGANRHVGQ